MSENKSIPTELTFREKATKEDLVQVCSVNYSMLVSKIMNSYQNDYIMKCSRHGFNNSQWFLVKFCWKLWIGFTFITFQNIKVPNLFMLIQWRFLKLRILNWPDPMTNSELAWTKSNTKFQSMNPVLQIQNYEFRKGNMTHFLFYFFQMRANMGDEEI